MSRRHLFFKLSADAGSFIHVTAFAELELKRYLTDLRPIGNVFELLKIPDLAHIIDRNPEIQHLITSALPTVNQHGYFATVPAEWPIEPYFRALNFVDEIFVFQRSHLSRDAFISMLIGRGLLKRFEVYNWHVYHGKSMPYYLRILQFRRPDLRNTDAVERFLKTLNLQTPGLENADVDWDPEPLINGNGFFSFASLRPQKALINWLTAEGGAFLDLSPGGGSSLQYASMRGISATGVANDALQAFLCNSKSFFYDIPLNLISDGIQKLAERLLQLTDARLTSQADLFLVDLDKEYILYRAKQLVARQSSARGKRNVDKDLFLMSRFLIDQNFITHNRDLNQFLMFALVRTVMQPKAMSNLHNFINTFKTNAQEIYLDLYALHRFSHLFGLKPEKTITVLNDPLNFDTLLDPEKRYGISVHLIPCRRTGRDTVFSWLREQFGITRAADDNLPSTIPDESEFGFYTREKLDFLKSFLKTDDYHPYLENCHQTYRLLNAVKSNQSHINRIAITTASTVFQIDDKPHIISYARVIEEMLQENFPQINASIYKNITLPMARKSDCQYEILLMEIQ